MSVRTSARPGWASRSGTDRARRLRQSRNTAASGWPSRDAYSSITPVGAPTISFSARWPALASSAVLSSSRHRAASAPAVATTSAAEEESPAPAGTSEWMNRSAPAAAGTSRTRASAHATPSGYPAQPSTAPGAMSAARMVTVPGAKVEPTVITPSSRRAAATAVRWVIANGRTKPSL